MATVKVCYATFDTDSRQINAVSLRGYMGYLFANDAEFHHHSESSHHYPKVQYKKIGHDLMILGLGEYADIIFERLANVEQIVTANQNLPVSNVMLSSNVFEIAKKQYKYCFVTPWIGLNENNYKKYLRLKQNERKIFLEKILVGNILSMLKGIGIRIDFKIIVKISKLRSKTISVHNNRFAGFMCDWESNISLPENCGLGKSVSKGFGVIRQSDN